MLTRCIWLGLWFVFSTVNCSLALDQQAIPPIIISGDDQDISLVSNHLHILKDSTKKITFEHIASGIYDSMFNDQYKGLVGLESNFWVKFNVVNNSPYDYVYFLRTSHCRLNEVKLYIKSPDNKIIEKRAGYSVPPEDRDYQHFYPVFNVTSSSHDTSTYYLQIPGTLQLKTELSFMSPKSFKKRAHWERFIFGIFFGLVIGLFVYNFLFAGSTNQPGFILYAICILLIATHALIYDGVLFAFSSYKYSFKQIDYSLYILTSFSTSAMFVFISSILRFKYFFTKIHHTLLMLVMILIILNAFYFIAAEVAWVIQDTVILIGFVLVIIYAFKLSLTNYSPAIYITAALIAILVAIGVDSVIYYYHIEGIEEMWYVYYTYYFGLSLSTILFAMAQSRFVRLIRQEKDSNQSEKIKKEQELREIQKKYTTDLELEVKQRTTELDKQNEVLYRQSQELKQIDSLKSRFFANISHELRTPLTLLTGHIQATLMEKYGRVSTPIKDQLSISKKNADQLLNLIDEILELSKLDAKASKVNAKPILPYAFIQRSLDLSQPILKDKRLSLTFDYVGNKEQLYFIDENLFGKIINNLLSNATKYTDNHGSILLHVSSQPLDERTCELCMMISDTGRGISEQDIDKIFDRYYQTSQAEFSLEGGTGIGLSLVKELVSLMNGSITVQSKLGHGSKFTLKIPLTLAETTQDQAPAPHVPSSRTLAETKTNHAQDAPIVLIVEDHLEMRNFIQECLSDQYRILTATNGLEALQVIGQEKVDLVLSDVMMPKMDGLQLLNELKSSPTYVDLSIIMLTARADQNNKLAALTNGVDDYITKPFDPEELLCRVKYVISNQRERKKWIEANQEITETVVESQFLQDVKAFIASRLDDPHLSVPEIADQMHISQSQLFKKVKGSTGLSPLQLIIELRLQEAQRLLQNKKTQTVSQAMKSAGFSKSDHFAKVFKKRFGKLPSEYLK